MKYITLVTLSVICTTVFGQDHEIKTLPIGSPAPDFVLPGTDNRNYSLADFAQFELLAVIFTCNHCPTAQAYEDRIIKMVEEYRPKGVGFVAISPNDPDAVSLSELGYSDLGDSMDDMKVRVKDKGYNFPYLFDGDLQATSIIYGAMATPHVFLFDQERVLRYSGRIDDTEDPYVQPGTTDLHNAIESLFEGGKVSAATTKTFGCSIKWSWKNEWIEKQRNEWSAEPVSLEELDLEGVKELIANQTDKLMLINVWATWCGPCVMEFPSFVEIHRMYRGRDFEFVSITTDKPSQKAKALAKLTAFEGSNRNFIFTGKDIYQLIEAVDPAWQGALPYTMLIEPGGKVLKRIPGIVTPQALKKQIVEYVGRYYADNK